MSLRCLVPACLAAATSLAATTRPGMLAELAGRARSQPAEFAADALLRIAAAPQLTDAAWKRELIEDAFHLAGSAQQPFARRNWTGWPATAFDKAYAQGLDTCTLQCRAVHAMLELDFKKARELFAGMPNPQLPRLTCDDALVYDTSIFYTTAAEVAARAFTAKEVAKDEPLHFLERYAAGLGSPVEAAPVARMLSMVSLKDKQFEILVGSFAGTLQQLSGDPRSFAATVSGESEGAAITALAAECTRRHIAAQPLLEAWRAYLVRNLKGPRCADVRLAGLRSALPPLLADEMKPASVDGKAVASAACQSPECRQLSAQFSSLIMGTNAMALSAEQKSNNGQWSGRLRQFLAAAADWKDSDNPSECFQIKSQFYSELFHTTPGGADRDLLLNALLTWLQSNSYQRDHRVEWFYPVNALIVRVFSDARGIEATARALRESSDPVISLYAQLELLLPRPITETIGLL